MDQIISLPSIEIPVTLVCAGNRRKEENMHKQSIGFNWGSAAISTSIWKGVLIKDILSLLQLNPHAKYICFEGMDKLPHGYYGTSISIERALSDASDAMLAYQMNGDLLTPDHGFPLRLILPGCIGGRMVKWLKKMIITEKESDNYYHYFDNRVLPSHVDAELAHKEGWWYRPEYIINELNINSVITSPAHNEIISLNNSDVKSTSIGKMESMNRIYTLKGYAYAGGNKKIIRVEISFDAGNTWILCNLTHPEESSLYQPIISKNNAYGTFRQRYYCWCFWTLDVPVSQLCSVQEIFVRAWDSSQNTQPKDLNWNVMGMMNNCWFKTLIRKSNLNQNEFIFEHPTVPGSNVGGWMTKQKSTVSQDKNKAITKPTSQCNSTIETSTPATASDISTPNELIKQYKQYTLTEISQHNREDDCWIIVHGKVYDCTKFLKEHPGGVESIVMNAGTDVTEEFDAIHSEKARDMLIEYEIGIVKSNDSTCTSTGSSKENGESIHNDDSKSLVTSVPNQSTVAGFLDKHNWKAVTLIEKRILSSDVRLFRFGFNNDSISLGLPVGQHLFLKSRDYETNKCIIRAYTPTSSPNTLGYFDLVIKIYFSGCHPEFPKGGRLTQSLEKLLIGEQVHIKGPIGSFYYHGEGIYSIPSHPSNPKFKRSAKEISMICGGTGITPMYQLLLHTYSSYGKSQNPVKISLIYCNRTEEDILLKKELEELETFSQGNLSIW